MMENYVKLLLQKYRFAVVLAVLRNKPSNISVEDYIMDLRNRIQEFEPQFSVNEDDFNMSDDDLDFNMLSDNGDDKSVESVTLLRDFDERLDKEHETQQLTKDLCDEFLETPRVDKASQNMVNMETLIIEKTSKDITNMELGKIPSAVSKRTDTNLEYLCNDKELKMRVTTNLNREQIEENPPQSLLNIYDSQATNYNSCLNTNYTQISQSQDFISVKTNHLTTDPKVKTYNKGLESVSSLNTFKKGDIDLESQSIQVHVRKKLKPIVYTESMIDVNINNQNSTPETQYSSPSLKLDQASNKDNKSQINPFNVNTNIEEIDCIDLTTSTNIIILDDVTLKSKNLNNSTKETELFSEFSGPPKNENVEYSENSNKGNIWISQQTKICEEPNLIQNINSTIINKINDTSMVNNESNMRNSQINNSRQNFELVSQDNLLESFIDRPVFSQDILMTMELEDNHNDSESQYLSRKECDSLFEYNVYSESQNMNIELDNTPQKAKWKLKGTESKPNEPLAIEDERETNINDTLLTNEDKDRINEFLHENDELNDLTESQAEIIPYKVIGELRKVKTYLNKIEFGSDSGFKSSKSSMYSASQSTHWLNQSAHSLFLYLSQAPLLVSSMEINCEIAKVLGELIDRLHENEEYPTFLEEILEFVANLILSIYEGKDDENNMFLKTDESIERLLLLNKSNNIIKFTIEKIIKVLESFYEHLEKDEIIELTNINRSENISYIFHLLETLLKKYTKFSQSFIQSTKLSKIQSQEEKPLKRSNLTEIWRKKWNLIKADVAHKQEKDILIDCSDILNKIIVKAMDRYSLVAYAALQCFNLLQS